MPNRPKMKAFKSDRAARPAQRRAAEAPGRADDLDDCSTALLDQSSPPSIDSSAEPTKTDAATVPGIVAPLLDSLTTTTEEGSRNEGAVAVPIEAPAIPSPQTAAIAPEFDRGIVPSAEVPASGPFIPTDRSIIPPAVAANDSAEASASGPLIPTDRPIIPPAVAANDSQAETTSIDSVAAVESSLQGLARNREATIPASLSSAALGSIDGAEISSKIDTLNTLQADTIGSLGALNYVGGTEPPSIDESTGGRTAKADSTMRWDVRPAAINASTDSWNSRDPIDANTFEAPPIAAPFFSAGAGGSANDWGSRTVSPSPLDRGSPSIDLGRTNDLLGQILDQLRRLAEPTTIQSRREIYPLR